MQYPQHWCDTGVIIRGTIDKPADIRAGLIVAPCVQHAVGSALHSSPAPRRDGAGGAAQPAAPQLPALQPVRPGKPHAPAPALKQLVVMLFNVCDPYFLLPVQAISCQSVAYM